MNWLLLCVACAHALAAPPGSVGPLPIAATPPPLPLPQISNNGAYTIEVEIHDG